MTDGLTTEAGKMLHRLLLDHEEKRPIDGELEPSVWLARITEQAALAATAATEEKKADMAGLRAEAVEHGQTVGGKLMTVAIECVGALAQLDALPTAASKQATISAIDQAVFEQLRKRETFGLHTAADWVIGTTALIGVPAAAIGHLDDRQRDLPDPRDTGAIFLSGDDSPEEVLKTGLLVIAVHCTTAFEFLM